MQFVEQATAPQHQRKDDWWIISRLLQEMGLPSGLDDENPDMLARARKILSRHGLTLEGVKAKPGQSAIFPHADRSEFFETLIGHPDGKVDCCPASFADSIYRCHRIFGELAEEPEGQLKLIGLRTNYMHNSNLANMPALKRGKHALNPLHINPEDAERLKLEEGTEVQISNRHGSITSPITIDDSLLKGVVAMSHGYGHDRASGLSRARATLGANVNACPPSAFMRQIELIG